MLLDAGALRGARVRFRRGPRSRCPPPRKVTGSFQDESGRGDESGGGGLEPSEQIALGLVQPPVVRNDQEDAHESGPLLRCQEKVKTILGALGLHGGSIDRPAPRVGSGSVNTGGNVRRYAGKMQVTVSPPPGVAVASTVPAAATTTCLTIASPSPVPSVVRAVSVR